MLWILYIITICGNDSLLTILHSYKLPNQMLPQNY